MSALEDSYWAGAGLTFALLLATLAVIVVVERRRVKKRGEVPAWNHRWLAVAIALCALLAMVVSAVAGIEPGPVSLNRGNGW